MLVYFFAIIGLASIINMIISCFQECCKTTKPDLVPEEKEEIVEELNENEELEELE